MACNRSTLDTCPVKPVAKLGMGDLEWVENDVALEREDQLNLLVLDMLCADRNPSAVLNPNRL